MTPVDPVGLLPDETRLETLWDDGRLGLRAFDACCRAGLRTVGDVRREGTGLRRRLDDPKSVPQVLAAIRVDAKPIPLLVDPAVTIGLDTTLDRVAELEAALVASVKLQSHYAELLNGYDGGERATFATVGEWLERLREVARERADRAVP